MQCDRIERQIMGMATRRTGRELHVRCDVHVVPATGNHGNPTHRHAGNRSAGLARFQGNRTTHTVAVCVSRRRGERCHRASHTPLNNAGLVHQVDDVFISTHRMHGARNVRSHAPLQHQTCTYQTQADASNSRKPARDVREVVKEAVPSLVARGHDIALLVVVRVVVAAVPVRVRGRGEPIEEADPEVERVAKDSVVRLLEHADVRVAWKRGIINKMGFKLLYYRI